MFSSACLLKNTSPDGCAASFSWKWLHCQVQQYYCCILCLAAATRGHFRAKGSVLPSYPGESFKPFKRASQVCAVYFECRDFPVIENASLSILVPGCWMSKSIVLHWATHATPTLVYTGHYYCHRSGDWGLAWTGETSDGLRSVPDCPLTAPPDLFIFWHRWWRVGGKGNLHFSSVHLPLWIHMGL